MKKAILVILTLLLFGTYPIQADLVFESGYNTYDDTDGYTFEVWVINDAILDVSGGEMYKLGLVDDGIANIFDGANIEVVESLSPTSNNLVNIYGGQIDVFRMSNSSVAHIYGGSIKGIDVWDATINLYAYDVTYHSVGNGEGWMDGKYFSNDQYFSFDVDEVDISHINVVPEPATLLLFGLGGLFLRKKK